MKKIPSKSILIIALVFFAMVLLNTFTIYTSDDISYLYVYEGKMPTETTRPVEDLGDVAESISNHYQLVNGRSLPHFILQFMAIFGKGAFNIANALAFCLAGVLIMAHIERDHKKWSWPAFLALYATIFLTFPQFGQSVLWISGSVNYLWMLNFILLASLAFAKWDRGDDVSWILAMAFNLLAGLASENGGGMVILFGLLCQVKWLREGRGLRPAPLLCTLAACLGLAYQLASPGNALRATGSVLDMDLLERLAHFLKVSLESTGLVLLLVLALILYRAYKGLKIPGLVPAYLISGLASALVLIFTPNMAHRSWLWLVAFCLISICLLAKDLAPAPEASRALALVLAGLAGFFYLGGLKDIHKSFQENQVALAQVQEQKDAGQLDATISRPQKTFNKYNPLSATYHLREDPDYWFNQWYAFHYGLDSVTISNPEDQR